MVRVTEPPVDERANSALVKLIAKRAGIANGRVRIVRGQHSREKLVRVDGLSLAEVRRALRVD